MRAPPKNGTGPAEAIGEACESPNPSPTSERSSSDIPPARCAQAITDLELLELLRDWRRDLLVRMERAQLCFELVGISDDTIGKLVGEGRAFLAVVKTLDELGT